MISKQKKPVEKPKKSVEKPKKPVEKPKKPVEKPKKPVLKKRVKNVNVDKIVKIIKKCIIKCGFKNPKLKGGGLKDMFKSAAKSVTENGKKIYNKITSKASKNEGDGECFKNLKNIDEVFKSIHMDVVKARTNLLKYLKEKRTETNKDLFDKLLSKYTFMEADDDNLSFHSYKYNTTINVDLNINNIDEITIENYLIVYIIDIVEQLERFRKGMLLCARKEWINDNKDNAELKGYDNDKKDLFKHKKDNVEGDYEDEDASANIPQSTTAPVDVYVDASEDIEEETTSIPHPRSESSLGSSSPLSRHSAPYAITSTSLPRKAELRDTTESEYV